VIESGDAEALETLYKNLRHGSDMARGDDTGKLKSAVVEWVNDIYGPSDPPLRANSKDERGLNNDHTGRLLCPGEYNWDDMSIRTKIREGNVDYPVTAQSWPMFCYASYTCDRDNLEKGLLRSRILVKAFKLLFTSPSSVNTETANEDPHPAKRSKKNKTATRSNVATLIGLRSVTPRSIAYIAVQVCVSLRLTINF
jgi:hypothetical protein